MTAGPYEHRGAYTAENLARVRRECEPECAPHLLMCCSLECEREELERRAREAKR